MSGPEAAGEDTDPAPGYTRTETPAHRLDRNYNELLQELRVAQTGVQILFAFLLGIAFQPRFAALGAAQHGMYLVALVGAAAAAVLLIAPVPIHRLLFRRRLKQQLVDLTARLAVAGLGFLGLSMLSAVLLIVDVVAHLAAAITITAVLGAAVLALWVLLPALVRRGRLDTDPDGAPPPADR